jgi:hypothetical protein
MKELNGIKRKQDVTEQSVHVKEQNEWCKWREWRVNDRLRDATWDERYFPINDIVEGVSLLILQKICNALLPVDDADVKVCSYYSKYLRISNKYESLTRNKFLIKSVTTLK